MVDNPLRLAAYVLCGALAAMFLVDLFIGEPLLLIVAVTGMLAVFCPNTHRTDTLEDALD